MEGAKCQSFHKKFGLMHSHLLMKTAFSINVIWLLVYRLTQVSRTIFVTYINVCPILGAVGSRRGC